MNASEDSEPMMSVEELAEEKNAFRTLAVMIQKERERVLADWQRTAERPQQLFHFTSAEGLLGIMQDRQIRASYAASLNDPSETQHALIVAAELLAKDNTNVQRQVVLANLRGHRGTGIGHIFPYVVSFCGRIDSAFHWLHYGRNGRGFAISLDPERMQSPTFDLLPIIYKRAEQERFLNDLIAAVESATESARPIVGSVLGSKLESMAASICTNVIRGAAARMKHASFEAEDEWRLITLDHVAWGDVPARTSTLELNFRAADTRVIPFVLVPMPDLPIREIVIGHSNAVDTSDAALKLLWQMTIGGPPRYTRSDVPVR
jgi:hypothetical protein